MSRNPLASIIILTRNQKDYLSKSLPVIFSQNYKNIEIILVDSASTDGSLELAKQYPLKIMNYAGPVGRNFNYAHAFNSGAQLAKGKFLVRLSGDAIPVNRYWLSNLLQPFTDLQVAGTFSKQIYDKTSDWGHKLLCFIVFSKYRGIFKSLLGGLVFWGASCALRKSVWEEIPFNETQKVAEDSRWSIEVNKRNYKTIYVPSSLVYHSHHRSLDTTLWKSRRTIKTFMGLFLRMLRYKWENIRLKNMNEKEQKTTQDIQDEIFRRMSAEKKIRLASELSSFCLKLHKLDGKDNPRKIVGEDNPAS